jgi:D,D-heptose 1,7-bisphosphate phosphatase
MTSAAVASHSLQCSQAVILCGGLGSRLGKLTEQTPKPLLPVNGRPFLEILLGELGRQGFRDILLLASFQSDKVRSFAASSFEAARFGLRIEVAVEPERADTGGALWHARDRLAETFLLLNGDSWFDICFGTLLRHLSLQSGCAGALALRKLEDASRYGVVQVDGSRIIAFHDRPKTAGPGLVNGGIYIFRKAGLIELLQPRCSIEKDVLPALAGRGLLEGLAADAYFVDIGVPEAYAKAQAEIPTRLRRPAVFFDRDGVLNHDFGHVGSIERFKWIDGAQEAIRLLNESGYLVFVVTNQAGIAKGLYSESDYTLLSRYIRQSLAESGAHIDDERFCPDHPEATIEHYRVASFWRKPNPGMILDLLNRWPVDTERSFLIGDKDSDLEAARAAGIKARRFTGGNLLDFLRTNCRPSSSARLHRSTAPA